MLVQAVERGGPREDSTRIGSAGVVRRQAVDVSPLRRVNQAIYLICTGARSVPPAHSSSHIRLEIYIQTPGSAAYASHSLRVVEGLRSHIPLIGGSLPAFGFAFYTLLRQRLMSYVFALQDSSLQKP